MASVSLKILYGASSLFLLLGLFFWYSSLTSLGDQDLEETLSITAQGVVKKSDRSSIAHAVTRTEGQEIRVEIPSTGDGSYSTQISFELPKPIRQDQFSYKIQSIQGTNGMSVSQRSETTISVYFSSLAPESHTTLFLYFPTDYFNIPLFSNIFGWLTSLSTLTWTLVALAEVILIYGYSRIRTRQKKYSTTKVRSTPPSDISSTELSVLLRGSLVAQDIASLIYSLADRGFLEIVDNGRDIHFFRTTHKEDLPPYEDAILSFIAPAHAEPKSLTSLIESLSGSIFSNFVSLIYIAVYESLHSRGYFSENIRSVHLRFKTAGIIIQFSGVITTLLSYFRSNQELNGLLIFGISTFLSGFIIYRTGYSIIPLSDKGRVATTEALEFKNFLTQSKEADNTNQGALFYSYLPYALVYRCPGEWLNRFTHSQFITPSWLTVIGAESFDPTSFIQQTNRITSVFSHLFVKVKDPNVD